MCSQVEFAVAKTFVEGDRHKLVVWFNKKRSGDWSPERGRNHTLNRFFSSEY